MGYGILQWNCNEISAIKFKCLLENKGDSHSPINKGMKMSEVGGTPQKTVSDARAITHHLPPLISICSHEQQLFQKQSLPYSHGVLLVNTISQCVGYPFGQLGTADPAMSLNNLLLTASPLTAGDRVGNRESINPCQNWSAIYKTLGCDQQCFGHESKPPLSQPDPVYHFTQIYSRDILHLALLFSGYKNWNKDQHIKSQVQLGLHPQVKSSYTRKRR